MEPEDKEKTSLRVSPSSTKSNYNYSQIISSYGNDNEVKLFVNHNK